MANPYGRPDGMTKKEYLGKRRKYRTLHNLHGRCCHFFWYEGQIIGHTILPDPQPSSRSISLYNELVYKAQAQGRYGWVTVWHHGEEYFVDVPNPNAYFTPSKPTEPVDPFAGVNPDLRDY